MAISFISSGTVGGSGAGNTVPTHAAGDLIVIFAFRDDGVDPGDATGAGYTDIALGGSGNFRWRLGYKIATSSSEVYGTWNGAVLVASLVYRGAGIPVPALYDGSSDSAGVFVYAPITPGSASSWVAAFVGAANNDNTGTGTAPAGMTARSSQGGSGRRIGSHDTNGVTAAFAGGTVAKGGTNGAWRTVTLEIAPLAASTVAYTEILDGYNTIIAKDKDVSVAYTEAADTLTGAGFQTRFGNTSYTEAVDGWASVLQPGRLANVTYTEALDTVTSNVDVLLNGTISYTEVADTVTSNVDVLLNGTVTYTEVADTVTGLIDKERAGLVTYTEVLDTVTSNVDVEIRGSVSYTEAADTTTSDAEVALSASVTYTELVDGWASSVDSGVIATVAYTEATDTLTSVSYVQRNADVSYTELVDGWASDLDSGLTAVVTYSELIDTLTATAFHGLNADVSYTEAIDGWASEIAESITADVAYTEALDGWASTLDPGAIITVAYTEAADTLTGVIEKGRIASVSYTEAVDGWASSIVHGIVATVTYTENNDTLSAFLADNISAEVAYTELVDGWAAVVSTGRSAYVVYTEAADTVTSLLTKDLGANVIYTETADTLSGAIGKELFGTVRYTEAADTVVSAAAIAITASVFYTEENDTLISGPVADTRECCPPRLCEITPSMLVCNYVNLLPSGPLWDRAKQRVIEHYVSCASDPAPPPCPVNPDTCSSVVTHAVYTGLRLYDVLQNGLWPALRESDPNTAFTTLDDWLARYEWVDCFYGTCRDPDLGPLTPFEFKDNCYTYFCEPNTPEDLQTAVKHGIVVALSRLSFGIMSRVDEINWVIEPLGAKLRLPANSTDCPISFEIVPLSEYLPSWEVMTCQGQESSPVQAWFDPNGCYNSGLPSKIWPGLMAAECIARSVMQRNQGIKINRIAC